MYFPQSTYYLATPLVITGNLKLHGESGYYDIALTGTVLKPATVAFTALNPDAQSSQFAYIKGFAFNGGTNPIDMGRFHGLCVEDCSFVGWSGNAICLYQGEKHSFRNIFFYPTTGVASSCFSFCKASDSTLTLTGTDASMFVDRVLIENCFLSPVSTAPINGVQTFIRCGGKFAHVTLQNVVAHSCQQYAFNLNEVAWCNFANITVDGGGVSGSPQAASFNVGSGGIQSSVFNGMSLSGGTYYRAAGFALAGPCYNTVFNGCEFGAGNNTSTYGFYWSSLDDGTAEFIRCTGAFFSTMYAYNAYRGGQSSNMLGCTFSPSNTPQVTASDNSSNDVILASLGGSVTGSVASTARASVGFSDGAGNFSIPFYVRKATAWFNGILSFTNAYGESIPSIIQVGVGSPNGVVSAAPGSLYMNTSGGAGNSLWVKETGVGTNTGWVAK